jgi:hypothetical protein
MQITQEELERRLTEASNLCNRISGVKQVSPIEESKRGNDENNRNNAGRKPEIPNAPASLRIVAGVLAKAEGNSAQVARNLKLTPGQVRYASSVEDAVAEGTSSKIKITEKQVQEVALNRLMDALGLLDAGAFISEKPKDISTIAANLSRVHSNLRPKDERAGDNVNITIYSPKQRRLEDFDVIEIQTGT